MNRILHFDAVTTVLAANLPQTYIPMLLLLISVIAPVVLSNSIGMKHLMLTFLMRSL